MILQRLDDLSTAQLEEMLSAKIRIVSREIDDGRFPAHSAFHAAPPEMTGRISTTSSAAKRESPEINDPFRMTR